MTKDQPTAPNMRSFSLNDPEAYEILCARPDRPWIPNGALPREPRAQDPVVVVERTRRESERPQHRSSEE